LLAGPRIRLELGPRSEDVRVKLYDLSQFSIEIRPLESGWYGFDPLSEEWFDIREARIEVLLPLQFVFGGRTQFRRLEYVANAEGLTELADQSAGAVQRARLSFFAGKHFEIRPHRRVYVTALHHMERG